jgi:hypothetical protein
LWQILDAQSGNAASWQPPKKGEGMYLEVFKALNGYSLQKWSPLDDEGSQYVAHDLNDLMQLIEELIRAEFKVEK